MSGFNAKKVFPSVRALAFCAILVAFSVIGKLLNIGIGNYLRLSLENTPVIAAGIIGGPIAGALTGAAADIIGCILHGYVISPIITIGMAVMGFIPGVLNLLFFKNSRKLSKYMIICLVSYLCASVIIKSIGLSLYYGTEMKWLMLRIPFAAANAVADALIIYAVSRTADRYLSKTGLFSRESEKNE